MESRRLALLPWFMLLLSCGGGTGAPSPAPLALRVVDARGWTPARFEVRVDANPEQVLRADCGGAGGANEGLACTATGATVLGVNPGAGVTIRSRGLRFAQTALAAGET